MLINVNCDQFSQEYFENLRYHKKDLIRIFKDHSRCKESELIYLEPKLKRDVFNLTLRPRLNNSSLVVNNILFNEDDVIEFENQTGLGFGIEIELILPINKDKWAIVIEPSYQTFQGEKTIHDVGVIFGGQLTSKIDYSSIEIPLTVRYYILLNDKSKLFLDASVVFDSSLESTFKFKSIFFNGRGLNINPSENFAYGLGYKFQNKISFQLRYQTFRDLLTSEFANDGNYFWFSDIEHFHLYLATHYSN